MTAAIMSESDLQTLHWWLTGDMRRLPPEVREHAATWTARMLEVRELQRTKNHGPSHREMLNAYHAADEQWRHDAELATNGFTGDLQRYLPDHPRPQLKDFMMHHRHIPTVTCPVCGTTFATEES
jgi:hypothetical protein